MNSADLERIESLSKQLGDGTAILDTRHAIADLIIDIVEEKQAHLGYWEKLYIARSIDALGWNTYALKQPTTAWLRSSLINLGNALKPPNEGRDEYSRRVDDVDEFTCDQLLARMEELKMLI
jgi:hypothetical protein